MDPRHNEPGKKWWICLPILALVLSFLTVCSVLFTPFPLLVALVAIVVGVVSLCMGKKRIGKVGIVLSIIAIGLALVLFVLVLWISRLMALGLFP